MLGGDEIFALLGEKDQENTEERGGQAGKVGAVPDRHSSSLGPSDSSNAQRLTGHHLSWTRACAVRTLQVLPAVPGESAPG